MTQNDVNEGRAAWRGLFGTSKRLAPCYQTGQTAQRNGPGVFFGHVHRTGQATVPRARRTGCECATFAPAMYASAARYLQMFAVTQMVYLSGMAPAGLRDETEA
jgi:hypothetical protein